MGEEKGEDGVANRIGQHLDTRFYSCHEPSGEKQEGEVGR